jgi:hypothetical protein
VRSEISALVASAPAALDTLNELATALGNDAAFSTTVTNSLALKAPLASPTFTGNFVVSSADSSFNGNLYVGGSSGITTNLIQSATNGNIVIEGRGTGDVILKTNSSNRISLFDNGQIDIAGSGGNPMNISTTGIITMNGASGTEINIGHNQTSGALNLGVNSSSNRTGAINLGTGGGAGAVATALNWGTSSNTGQLSFQGGSFNLLSTGVYTQNSVATFDTNIDAFNKTTGQINIGTGIDLTIAELAEKIAENTGFTGSIDWDVAREDGTPQKVLDIQKITNLGWKPTINLDQGIKLTVEWYLENK